MNQSILFALALAAATPIATLVGGPASAQSSDCLTQIANLRSAAETIAISGKNADKDRSGLVGKLDSASTELSKGKNLDAANKLGDFRVKVGQLAAAGRISAADAASLTSQADSAIACLNGTMAPAAS